MFNILYGTAETDRQGCLLGKLRENLERKIRSYVLVPEQFSVSAEKKVLENLGPPAQTMIEVLTFSRLANEILSALGPLRLNYIDGAGREIVARRALKTVESELTYLKSNVNRRGFSTTLAELVSELRRYGVTPDDLETASAKTDKTSLRGKLNDIAKFCRVYTALIDEKFSDAEDNLAIAAEKLGDYPIPNGSELFIEGFKSFTPLENDVLLKLIDKMNNTFLIICCDDPDRPSDVFAAAADTARSLRDAVSERGTASQSERLPLRSDIPADLLYLRRNFFEVNPKKFKGEPEHIHIISPNGYYDEAERCAREIHRLIRTRDLKQNDFLILARNCENYDRILPLIFKKYELNIFIDSKRSIMQNPFVRSLTAVLETLAYGFSYERTAVMAKSGFAAVLPREHIDIFDNYLLEVDPSHAMWNDEGPWLFNPDERAYDMEFINSVKNAVLGPLYRIKKALSGRKTVSDIVSAVLQYIEECDCEKTMRDKCRRYSDSDMIYLAEAYRRVWNSVISILSRLDDVMGGEKVTYEDFYELFTSACTGTEVGVSPQTLDEVTFSSIDLFRSTDAKIVFVLGVNYGVFPKGYSAEGLINDSERDILRGLGIRLAMTAPEKSEDEQNMIYSVLSAPSDELYLMAPLMDNSGENLDPSKIITKIRDRLFDSKYFGEEPECGILDLESPDVIFDALKRVCSRRSCNSFTPEETAVYDYFMKDDHAQAELIRYLEKIRSAEKGYDKLSKSAALGLYGRELMLSASRLEKFNACAFSYFMRYGLMLTPRGKADFDPMSMGNILHAALEKYFRGKADKNADYAEITKSDCEADMEKIVHELSEGGGETMYSTMAYYKYLIMRISGIAAATAWETVKFYQNSDFRPYGFEIEIDDEGSLPPLVIKTDAGSARIRGKVDRADFAVIDGEKYISIIDYKSSARNLDTQLAKDGVHFQPLVYANALCAGLDMRPAAMLYQQMNDPIIDYKKAATPAKLEKQLHDNIAAKGWVVDDDGIGDAFDKTHTFVTGKNAHIPAEVMRLRLDEATKKIKETTEGIFSGKISINPYKQWGFDPCEYCDYLSICSQSL